MDKAQQFAEWRYRRSLALGRLTADKLRENPLLFEAARETVAQWRKIVCDNSQPYVREWERLIDLGLDECLRVLEEDSEQAHDLRKTAPFFVLSPKERLAWIEEWSKRKPNEV